MDGCVFFFFFFFLGCRWARRYNGYGSNIVSYIEQKCTHTYTHSTCYMMMCPGQRYRSRGATPQISQQIVQQPEYSAAVRTVPTKRVCTLV
jgi:hypothetical protein